MPPSPTENMILTQDLLERVSNGMTGHGSERQTDANNWTVVLLFVISVYRRKEEEESKESEEGKR